MIVYRCPVHGLIESPTWHEDAEESGYYCPINLSTDASGITDDVCGKRCEGPFRVTPTGSLWLYVGSARGVSATARELLLSPRRGQAGMDGSPAVRSVDGGR